MGPVKCDGFKKGVLLEAKGPGYRKIFERMYGRPFFEAVKKMLNQAKSQFGAADGLPIEWHFAEREVAEIMRQEFRRENLGAIKVIHTPALP
jgi:hypothetical protein